MNVNQPTTGYFFRKSNLMHSYYAVNSIDGRYKASLNKENSLFLFLDNIITETSLFFNSIFQFNFSWKGIFPRHKTNMLPNVTPAPNYLNVNLTYINTPNENTNFGARGYKHHYYNTTHK